MSAEPKISRRAFAGGLLLAGLARNARAQGFAGLGESGNGFAKVVPGKHFDFPGDHGPHPDFRIEWWYVTANLTDAAGQAYGLQWTLFRQAARPGPQGQGWESQQIWMAHAAVTRADTHRSAEKFARGGVGQAGVVAKPFQAWIDAWQMTAPSESNDQTLSPLEVTAAAADFSYALQLSADRPVVLQGEAGYSRKSERNQASYYYSQPFYRAHGRLTIEGKPVEVSGQAWLDREWSSQPLSPDQTGWDWFSLHFDSGEKLMLYRMRQTDGHHYASGTWIAPDGVTTLLRPADIVMTPKDSIEMGGHRLPVSWHVELPSRAIAIECTPLNPKAWMGTSVPYWEGPISFKGSHAGVGYLELTGY
ncbi:lipocalin-like domain-containing protein [Bradyrhizobium sp. STM 3557]|uniref:lipocalin-like domain-containing protein n=1 Tax=Bradyrhizobium sp. STM 3557 TaxID=578920 RepID=UPI00388D296C